MRLFKNMMLTHDSYISEAAASLLDERLQLNIVPRTELVSLASPVSTLDDECSHAAHKREGVLLRLVG